MRRKIFAGVLVLALLALPGCVSEDEPEEITIVRNSESGIICCGPAPESGLSPSQPAESSPDDIKFRKAKGAVCYLESEICELPLAPDGGNVDSSLPASEKAGGVRAVSVRETPVPLDAKTITVLVSNPTDEEITFGEDYWLEKQNENGTWEKLKYLPDTAWHDIGLVVPPHTTGTHEISPVYFYGEEALQPGHYRYGNQFDGETLYAEFDFVEPGGESLPRSDEENARQELKNALGGLQKKGPDDPPSRPEPSKYVQQIN